ncbi:histone H3.v1-like isoform X3 [Homalodisca vitripennis]|uniref:histone H3.v1-like isoform X3 n=1 Tax=Homalodisca vitripennis TaxID=197043 RepID=UPI001EEB41E2|nr:histone H3.v1-like isoform X3 [Homalodisca vitripennis]
MEEKKDENNNKNKKESLPKGILRHPSNQASTSRSLEEANVSWSSISEEEEEEEEEESEEEKKKRESFQKKRKEHYNEFIEAKKKLAELEDADDENSDNEPTK